MAKSLTEIKSIARQHTARAIAVLAGIMDEPKAPPAARVAAITALLDRGWGKPTQPVSGDDDAPGISIIVTGVKRDGD